MRYKDVRTSYTHSFTLSSSSSSKCISFFKLFFSLSHTLIACVHPSVCRFVGERVCACVCVCVHGFVSEVYAYAVVLRYFTIQYGLCLFVCFLSRFAIVSVCVHASSQSFYTLRACVLVYACEYLCIVLYAMLDASCTLCLSVLVMATRSDTSM